MTALPPAGWYPDPQVGGTRWRWWDGYAWAPPSYGYDPAAAALALVTHRDATSRYGNWLRWAMAANVGISLLALGGIAFFLHRKGFDFGTTDPDGTPHFSSWFVVVQFASLPLNLVSLAYLGSLIAWLYQAGKFAEARGWPAVRGRALGAFSVIIPVVNLWWPYEAVRDSYPPGSDHSLVLRWWLSYLLVPFAAGAIAIGAGFFGSTAVVWIALLTAGCLLAIPVWLGWQVIRDVEVMQRANSPAAA